MNFPIAAALVVPHSARMLLIDSVLGADESSLSATATIHPDNPFLRDGLVGAWVGVEYMAQAIAAFEGCRARARGDAPKVGFLIGSRQFRTSGGGFSLQATLHIHVSRQYEEGGLGLFDGTITSMNRDGESVSVEASVSVYQPDDARQFVAETRA